jgi:hypothetical protein
MSAFFEVFPIFLPMGASCDLPQLACCRRALLPLAMERLCRKERALSAKRLAERSSNSSSSLMYLLQAHKPLLLPYTYHHLPLYAAPYTSVPRKQQTQLLLLPTKPAPFPYPQPWQSQWQPMQPGHPMLQ